MKSTLSDHLIRASINFQGEGVKLVVCVCMCVCVCVCVCVKSSPAKSLWGKKNTPHESTLGLFLANAHSVVSSFKFFKPQTGNISSNYQTK